MGGGLFRGADGVEHKFRIGMGLDACQFDGGHARVHRHGDGTDATARHQHDRHFEAVLCHDHHPVPGNDPGLGHLVGLAAYQRGIFRPGDRTPVAVDHRDRVRARLCLPVEHLMNLREIIHLRGVFHVSCEGQGRSRASAANASASSAATMSASGCCAPVKPSA